LLPSLNTSKFEYNIFI